MVQLADIPNAATRAAQVLVESADSILAGPAGNPIYTPSSRDFDFTDLVRATLKFKDRSPELVHEVIAKRVEIDGLAMTNEDFAQGVTAYLRFDFDPTQSLEQASKQLALYSGMVDPAVYGLGFRDAIIAFVRDRRNVEIIDKDSFDSLVTIGAKMADDVRNTLVEGVLRDQTNEPNIAAANGQFGQRLRLASGLTGRLMQGMFLSDESVIQFAISYSPGEIAGTFGECMSAKQLGQVLGIQAAHLKEILDPAECAFIFDPESSELEMFTLTERNVIGRHFASEFLAHQNLSAIKEHRPAPDNEEIEADFLTKFGSLLAEHPDANVEIIHQLGSAFTNAFPGVTVSASGHGR